MYIIITKSNELVNYARKNGDAVFREQEFGMLRNAEGELNIESFLTAFLGWLAIDPDILGYDYIKHVLYKCIKENGYYKKTITKEIYPELARYFNTTTNRVERAIRHAIEVSFEEVPGKYVILFNRELKEKPNNAKFIAMLAVTIENILAKTN